MKLNVVFKMLYRNSNNLVSVNRIDFFSNILTAPLGFMTKTLYDVKRGKITSTFHIRTIHPIFISIQLALDNPLIGFKMDLNNLLIQILQNRVLDKC